MCQFPIWCKKQKSRQYINFIATLNFMCISIPYAYAFLIFFGGIHLYLDTYKTSVHKAAKRGVRVNLCIHSSARGAPGRVAVNKNVFILFSGFFLDLLPAQPLGKMDAFVLGMRLYCDD